MNYSLRTLLLTAAGLSIVCASLVYATPLIGDLFYTFGLLMIAYGTIAAIYFQGKRRAYWVGFLILFAGYFCHSVWPSEIRSTWAYFQRNGSIGYTTQGLITTRLLAGAYEGLHPSSAPSSVPMRGGRTVSGPQTAGQYIAFMTAGHTVIALFLGIGGGVVAQRFASRSLQSVRKPIENYLREIQ